jgi:hypothetical protein
MSLGSFRANPLAASYHVHVCLPPSPFLLFFPSPTHTLHTHIHLYQHVHILQKQVVQTLNPWAAVIPANFSRVSLGDFLGVNEGKMGALPVSRFLSLTR